MTLFEETHIGTCTVKNRLIRSATFEGMCDSDGIPTNHYISHYRQLARKNIGGIITGFTYISKEGKAIHPGQAGLYSHQQIPRYRSATSAVHESGSKIFIQLAHTGRQTRKKDTGQAVAGVTTKASSYFRGQPFQLTENHILNIIEQFGDSARYAREAGFDGVQLHAAHGYLIHQFIHPAINTRKDQFGIDKQWGIGTLFLHMVIENIRQKCGDDYPLLIKISAGDDYLKHFTKRHFIQLIKFLNHQKTDAIEISYGTMDMALNIFRGGLPLKELFAHNLKYSNRSKLFQRMWRLSVLPFLKIRIKAFRPMYNLKYADLAKNFTSQPLISVGGFRSRKDIRQAIEEHEIDFVSLCRPFICEPDFAEKLATYSDYTSLCSNCNTCAIMCDSNNYTKCYKTKSHENN
jgi:2,4-dienoyl-CoA reductase-like NADH-dependent reductase (Old Yellow Enzyme family)